MACIHDPNSTISTDIGVLNSGMGTMDVLRPVSRLGSVDNSIYHVEANREEKEGAVMEVVAKGVVIGLLCMLSWMSFIGWVSWFLEDLKGPIILILSGMVSSIVFGAATTLLYEDKKEEE